MLFGPIAEDSLGMGVDATGLLFAAPGIGGILAPRRSRARLAATRPYGCHAHHLRVFLAGIPLTTLSVVHSARRRYLPADRSKAPP